jgi:hypothetical protein
MRALRVTAAIRRTCEMPAQAFPRECATPLLPEDAPASRPRRSVRECGQRDKLGSSVCARARWSLRADAKPRRSERRESTPLHKRLTL